MEQPPLNVSNRQIEIRLKECGMIVRKNRGKRSVVRARYDQAHLLREGMALVHWQIGDNTLCIGYDRPLRDVLGALPLIMQKMAFKHKNP